MKIVFTFALVAMVVVAIGLGVDGLQSAPPKSDVNAAQFTAGNATFNCPSNQFTPSDMQVTLTTEGRPVLVSFTALANMAANAALTLQPTIDGVAPDTVLPAFIQENIGVGATSSMHYNRLYAVPAGTHVFGVQLACQNGASLGPRWLTVFEFQGR